MKLDSEPQKTAIVLTLDRGFRTEKKSDFKKHYSSMVILGNGLSAFSDYMRIGNQGLV